MEKSKHSDLNLHSDLSLFENVCTCGNEYGECTVDLKDCPSFQKYKAEVNARFEKRINKLIQTSKNLKP